MAIRMGLHNKSMPAGNLWNLIGRLVLAVALLAPVSFLCGCMTPEDKAFYGRGWLNPSELDHEQEPPRSFTDPNTTDVEPRMMGPGNY